MKRKVYRVRTLAGQIDVIGYRSFVEEGVLTIVTTDKSYGLGNDVRCFPLAAIQEWSVEQ